MNIEEMNERCRQEGRLEVIVNIVKSKIDELGMSDTYELLVDLGVSKELAQKAIDKVLKESEVQ